MSKVYVLSIDENVSYTIKRIFFAKLYWYSLHKVLNVLFFIWKQSLLKHIKKDFKLITHLTAYYWHMWYNGWNAQHRYITEVNSNRYDDIFRQKKKTIEWKSDQRLSNDYSKTMLKWSLTFLNYLFISSESKYFTFFFYLQYI